MLPPVDLADQRFQRAVARLHRFGERPLYELLSELGRERLLGQVIENMVARYVDRLEAIGPETLAVVGATDLPLAPIHTVMTSGSGGPARRPGTEM